jgi:signal transduction protein with GAF and PtsI domain
MIYEPSGHLFTPVDEEAPRRVVRLRELGLGERPEPEFDEFARSLATTSKAPLAMVNFIDENRQYFAGLYAPDLVQPGPGPVAPDDPARVMRRDQGWCPHVVVRRLPLVLDDVCDYPRFAGNPVVDEVGIRSYIGAPLIDRTGTALGTICIVDREPRPWGRPGLDFIKSRAAELMELIHQREQRRG